MKYSEKLKDPRWQKKRLEIFERDNFACQACGDDAETLHIHHLFYRAGIEPWEYENNELLTLCHDCHEYEYLNRPSYEKGLLLSLSMKGFLSGHLKQIGNGFYKIGVDIHPDIISAVLEWVLLNADVMRELRDRYFNNIAASRERKVSEDKDEVV